MDKIKVLKMISISTMFVGAAASFVMNLVSQEQSKLEMMNMIDEYLKNINIDSLGE